MAAPIPREAPVTRQTFASSATILSWEAFCLVLARGVWGANAEAVEAKAPISRAENFMLRFHKVVEMN